MSLLNSQFEFQSSFLELSMEKSMIFPSGTILQAELLHYGKQQASGKSTPSLYVNVYV
jgi:hypothetical protein